MNGPALRHRPPAAAPIERDAGAGAVVSRREEGDLNRLTRAALTERARRLAAALAGHGMAPGHGVATLAWTGHRHLEVAFAACGSGAVFEALDPGLHPDVILRMALGSGARALFFDLSFTPVVEEIAPGLPAATLLVALTDRASMPVPPAARRLLCYEDLLDGAPETPAWPVPAAAPARSGEAFVDVGGDPDVVLAAIPMWRVEGPHVVRSAWNAGATVVLPGPWLDGGSLRELAEREGATVVAAPTALWQGLLASVEREGKPLPRVRGSFLVGDDGGTLATPAPVPAPRVG